MVYIEAQDKKIKFGIKTNELQAGWFDQSKDRFDWSKIAYQQNQQMLKHHNLFVWNPNRELFFPVFKGYYKLILGGVLRVF